MHPLCADELRRTEMASTAAVVRQYVFVSPETSINAGNNLSSKCHPWSHCGAKARRSPRKSSVQQASASCVFSKAQSSPGKPQCFSAVGGARSGCNEASTLFPQSSIGPIGTVSTPVFRSSFLFLTQGKIPLPPLHFFSTFTQWEPDYEVSASSPALSRYGNRESRGYSFGHLPCQRQTLLTECLLHVYRPVTSSKLPGSQLT